MSGFWSAVETRAYPIFRPGGFSDLDATLLPLFFIFAAGLDWVVGLLGPPHPSIAPRFKQAANGIVTGHSFLLGRLGLAKLFGLIIFQEVFPAHPAGVCRFLALH